MQVDDSSVTVAMPRWRAPPGGVTPLRLELGQIGGRHLATSRAILSRRFWMHLPLDAGRQVERLPPLEASDVFQHMPRIGLDG